MTKSSFVKMGEMFLASFVLTFGVISSAAGKDLTSTEQAIVQSIKADREDDILLLKKAVNINSGTMNFAGVKQVGQVFAAELEALGFKTQWVDGQAFNRAGHLLANIGTTDQPKDLQVVKGNVQAKTDAKTIAKTKILLIGHLDTVFSKDSPFQSFKRLDSRYVAGPGISDMKGGDVIIISALRALKKAGVLDKMAIKVMMMGDEEKRGSPYEVATKSLIDAGKWADVALGFEDGDGNPKTAVISRRGATDWVLSVKGRPAHSSQIFRKTYGYGAIFEASRILNEFRIQLANEPNLTFNPGVIVGGTRADFDKPAASGSAFGKSNVIPETVIVNGDIRALTPEQLTGAQATMRKIVANNLNLTSATIDFNSGYPPMAPNDNNKKLLALYDEISQTLGHGPVQAVDPRKAGAADISFVAKYVDQALDGLGLMGPGGHTVKEKADMDTLTSQTERAALLIYRLNN